MKKITFLLVLFTISFSLNAQEKDSLALETTTKEPFPSNEVSINLARTVFEAFLEASYERVLSEDFAIGSNLGFILDKGNHSLTNFQLLPYVNWYFNGNSNSHRKYGAGFFIQANLALSSQNTHLDTYTGYTHTRVETELVSSTNFGIGIGFGWKFISENNWIGIIDFGGGRNLIKGGDHPPMGYFTGGIRIGKRF